MDNLLNKFSGLPLKSFNIPLSSFNSPLRILVFLFLLVTCYLSLVTKAYAFTQDATSLPESLQNHASVTVDLPGPNERVYVIGGFNSQNQASNKIYSIKVNSNNTLDGQGGWRTETNLSTALAFPSVTLIDPGSNQDKILYIIGGEAGNGAGINPSNVVYKATVDKSTGVVSSFVQLNSLVQKLDPVTREPIPGSYEPIRLPKNLYGHQLITGQLSTGNYIYVIGGDMPGGHTTIYRATLDSNFNLVNNNSTDPASAFQPLTSNLPLPLQHHQASLLTKDKDGNALSSPSILISGGLIASGVSDKIYTTKINTDGTLTNFTQETLTLPEQVFFHSQDVNPADGTLIITGGKKQDRTTRGEAKLDKLTRLSLNSSGNVNSIDDLTGGIGEALEGHTLRITKSGKTILLGGQKDTTSIVNGRTTTTNPLDPSSRTDSVTSIKTRNKISSLQLPVSNQLSIANSQLTGNWKLENENFNPITKLFNSFKKLLFRFGPIAQRGVDQNGNSQNKYGTDKIESLQGINVYGHDFPLIRNKLAHKEIAVTTTPDTTTTGSRLSSSEKTGSTKDASNTNERLAKNSDSLFTWLSFNLGNASTKNNSITDSSADGIKNYDLDLKNSLKILNLKLKIVSLKSLAAQWLHSLIAYIAPPVLAAHTPSDGAKNYTTNTTISAGSTNNFDAVTVYDGTTPAAVTLTLSNTSAITFNTHGWTVGNGTNSAGTINFTGTSLVTINANSNTVTLSGTGGIGNITHTANTTALSYYVNLSITGNLTVNSGGLIDVNGKGYNSTTSTTGRGGTAGGSGGGGGGHGGTGGVGAFSATGGATHDSLTSPADLGGGGGQTNGDSGSGAGLVRLTVSGTTTINGTVRANGNATSTNHAGGAGGGIYLSTGTFTGTGTITADGGGGNTTYGGGGGGGRIAIVYTTDTSSLGTFTAYGGLGTEYGGAGTLYKNDSDTSGNQVLTIDNNSQTNGGTAIPSSNTWTIDTLNLKNAGDLRIPAGTLAFSSSGSILTTGSNLYIRLSGGTLTPPNAFTIPSPTTFSYTSGTFNSPSTSLTLANGATFTQDTTSQLSLTTNITISGNINHTANSTAISYKVNLNITGSFTLDSNGTITVTGRGYNSTTSTTGRGGTVGGSGGGGGGHGGTGGVGASSATSGATHDSLTSPADLGGGGGQTSGNSGSGGGLVQLTVSGTTTINGTINAGGNNGSSLHAGGAGGGIYISTASFTGTGTITTNGGNADATTHGGGGGGGRVAIIVTGDFGGASGPTINNNGGTGYQGGQGGTTYLEYATKTYAGTVTVTGGTGGAGGNGSAGTKYEVGTPASPSSLIQAATSGGTSLSAGSNITSGTTAYLRATATDADPGTNPTSETLKLQTEVRAVGTAFTSTATHTGSTVSYSGSSVTTSVDSSSLSQGTSYHWQARVCDNSSGLSLGDYSGGDKCSSWVSFGGNAESATDFLVVGVPGAPTSVTAAVASTTSATVTWTAPSDNGGGTITSYTVTSSPGSKTATWSSGSLTATVTSLTRGTAYTFTVTATNVAGTGSASSASSSITAKLNEPTSFAGTADASGKIKWTWTDNSSDETGFKLYDSSDHLKATISTASTTSYTESGLTRNTSYSRYLVAYDSIGNSTATSTVSVTTKATDPTSPDIQSPKTNEVISSTRPEIEWKKATDTDDTIDSYSVTLSYYNTGSTIFIISSVPKDGSSTSCGSLTGSVRTCSYTKYKVTFTNEDTTSTDDDRIILTTKSSSSWISSELDGAFPVGAKLNLKVTAHNSAGGAASSSQPFTISSEPPKITNIAISDKEEVISKEGTYYITGDKPTLTATVSSLTTLKELIITLSKRNTTLGITTSNTPLESTTLTLTDVTLDATTGKYAKNISWTPRGTLEQDVFYTIDLTLIDTGSLTSTQEISVSRVSKARLEKLSNLESVSLVELEKQALVRKQKEAENLNLAINKLIPTALQEYISNSILTLNILPQRLAAAIQSTMQTTANRLQTTATEIAQAVLTPITQAIASVLPTQVKKTLVQVATTTTNALNITQQITQPLNQAFTNAQTTRPKKAQEEIFKSVGQAAEGGEWAATLVGINVNYLFNKAAPTITDVTIEEVGDTYAIVSWKSNHYSTGKLNYGLEPGEWFKNKGGGEVFSSKKKKLHRVKVEGIEPNTKYYFEVMSQNGGYVYDAFYGFATSE